MWYVKRNSSPDWSAARRHLSRVDPALAGVIKRIGPCTLVPRRDYFNVLCISIFNQQISTKIATILFNRFRDEFPGRRPTPRRALNCLADDAVAKRCGLSRQKRGYLIDLSRHFVESRIPTRRFRSMSDAVIIDALAQVKGIGRWTAEMFLMFVLNRPDVLPVDDLGLREAVKRVYKLDDRPGAKELTRRGEVWRPWRSIATWYLWRGMGD